MLNGEYSMHFNDRTPHQYFLDITIQFPFMSQIYASIGFSAQVILYFHMSFFHFPRTPWRPISLQVGIVKVMRTFCKKFLHEGSDLWLFLGMIQGGSSPKSPDFKGKIHSKWRFQWDKTTINKWMFSK